MAEHIGTHLVVTERLILRRALMEDAVDMFQNWASDPHVTKYLTWPSHNDLQATKTVLKQWIQNYDAPDYYQWMIVPKDSNTPLGSISVVRYDSDTDTAEIGYCIGKKWWNQGLTTEALKAVIQYLFDRVNISNIEARHDINNPASGAVMRKCGMLLQEIAPNAGRNNQGICDLAVCTISKRSITEKRVHVIVDRPLGSRHPKHTDIIYEVNYGFIPGVMAQDGEEQDAYILGVDHPVSEFWGKVIAIARRLDDVEDKWIVVPDNTAYTKEEIACKIAFQEKFFRSELIMLDMYRRIEEWK